MKYIALSQAGLPVTFESLLMNWQSVEGPKFNGIPMPPKPAPSVSLNPFDELLGETNNAFTSQTGGTLGEEEEGFDDFQDAIPT